MCILANYGADDLLLQAGLRMIGAPTVKEKFNKKKRIFFYKSGKLMSLMRS